MGDRGEWVVVRHRKKTVRSGEESKEKPGAISKSTLANQKKREAKKRSKTKAALAVAQGGESANGQEVDADDAVSREEFVEESATFENPEGFGIIVAETATERPKASDARRENRGSVTASTVPAGKSGIESILETADREDGDTGGFVGESRETEGIRPAAVQGSSWLRFVGDGLSSFWGTAPTKTAAQDGKAAEADSISEDSGAQAPAGRRTIENALASPQLQKDSPPGVSGGARIRNSFGDLEGPTPTGSSAGTTTAGKPMPGKATEQLRSREVRGSEEEGDWERAEFQFAYFPGVELQTGGNVPRGHNELVSCAAVSGNFAATSSWDCTVKIWAWPDPAAENGPQGNRTGELSGPLLKEVRQLAGHGDRVECVTMSPPGEGKGRLLTGARDCTIRLWDVASGQQLKKLYVYESVKAVAARWRLGMAMLGGKSGTVGLWSLETSQQVQSLRGHSEEITCLALDGTCDEHAGGAMDSGNQAGGGPLFASGSAGGDVRVWDLRQGQVVTDSGPGGNAVGSAQSTVFTGKQKRVYSLALYESTWLLVGDFSGSVKLHDLRKGGQIAAADGPKGLPWTCFANAPHEVGCRAPISGLCLGGGTRASQGRILVSTAAGWWDEEDEENEGTEVEGCLQIHSLSVDLSGSRLARKDLCTLRPGGGLLTCLALQGKRILAGDVNGTVFGLELLGRGLQGSLETASLLKGQHLGQFETLED